MGERGALSLTLTLRGGSTAAQYAAEAAPFFFFPYLLSIFVWFCCFCLGWGSLVVQFSVLVPLYFRFLFGLVVRRREALGLMAHCAVGPVAFLSFVSFGRGLQPILVC